MNQGAAPTTLRNSGSSRPLAAFVLLAALLLVTGCSKEPRNRIVVAVLPEVQDSGLLTQLSSTFQERFAGYKIKAVSVPSSGAALALARRGEVDVVLINSPGEETRFIDEVSGAKRLPVMHDEFILVGPPSDPAGAGDSPSIEEAVARIATAGTSFISRSDSSPSARLEESLWRSAGIEPSGNWYLAAGQSMREVLSLSSQRQAYTLTDRASWVVHARKLSLRVLFEGDPRLIENYSAIRLSDGPNPEGARIFTTWLTSPDGRAAIGTFGKKKFGQTIFRPGHARSASFSSQYEATGDTTSEHDPGLNEGAPAEGGSSPRHDLPESR